MRVAIAVHHFPPNYSAGAELRAFRTARWLANHGHDLQIITVENIESGSSKGIIAEDDVYHGIKVHRLSFDLSKSQDKDTWEYNNPLIFNHLQTYLQDIEPDIFHAISGYLLGAGAINAAISHDIPVVITLTDFWFFCPRINLVRPDGTLSDAKIFDVQECTRCRYEEQRRFLFPARIFPGLADSFWKTSFDAAWSNLIGIQDTKNMFEERNKVLLNVLSQASAIICPSRFLSDSIIARGLSPEKISIVQHGLDKSNWDPIVESRSNGVFKIGYLGQISKHKGLHILIRAFKILQVDKPIELIVYGDNSTEPSYTDSLYRLVDNDLRIKFLGKYSYNQIGNIFSQLDVVVIPSIWNEIGPWVMYEALDTKTPVLASDIPNMSHIIHHGENGLLFECGNWQDLVNELQRLIEDDDLRRGLIDGIKPVNTIENEMNDLLGIYQRVVDGESNTS